MKWDVRKAGNLDDLVICQVREIISEGRARRNLRQRAVVLRNTVRRYTAWELYKLRRWLRARRHSGAAGKKGKRPGDSGLQAGDWVRVKDYEEIQRTLTDGKTPDGLAFVEAPMRPYCGRKLRVEKVLTHFYDEAADRMWKKRHTVVLEGSTCDSSQLTGGHCDRGCLLFWNDQWLERVAPPEDAGEAAEDGRERPDKAGTIAGAGAPAGRQGAPSGIREGALVRVRSVGQIEATLGPKGFCGGVKFVPEHMGQYCGGLYVVSGIVRKFYDERDDMFVEPGAAYKLRGVSCSGWQGEGRPSCDRGCSLIWDERWLEPAGHLA